MKKNILHFKFWKSIFIIYCIFTFVFVLLKFDGNVYNLQNRISSIYEARQNGYLNLNIVPLRSISMYLVNIASPYAFFNIVGNIVIFIPLGFLLPINFKYLENYILMIIYSFIIIFCIEVLQFMFLLGYFDLDDIILNMLGSNLGYIFFIIWRKIKK